MLDGGVLLKKLHLGWYVLNDSISELDLIRKKCSAELVIGDTMVKLQ